MCGIAGYIGTRQFSHEVIQHCLRLMHHRGPDHAAYYTTSFSPQCHVTLLNTRLSIIDLDERSNPPFRIGSKVMVYNGELYNYLELRSKMEKEVDFRTQSDTEVLLQTIIQHGWQGLDACEGMWAFAVFDEKDGSLLLSRDRFGEKPLYLYRDASGMYFASEVKFIFALLGHSLPINTSHLYRYLMNGYKALNKVKETFFIGIEELPPAYVSLIDAEGNEKRWRYWQPSYQQDDSMSLEEAIDKAKQALLRAVQLRLRADVPLAFCLSGGIDSNTLISIAKRVFNYDVHGFTIVNTDKRYEEQEMVQTSVRELGIRHTQISADTREFLPKLRQLVRQHDGPVYTINYYAHWLLMQSVAAHGYKISLSGTGADELFSGYYDHHLFYLYEVRNNPVLFQQSLELWRKNILPYVQNPFLKNPFVFIENPQFRDHIYLDSQVFASYLHKPWQETFVEEKYSESLMRNRMLNEVFHEAVPVLLHQDDHNAMACSIENRSPFLDRQLFEISMTIPTRYLIGEGKAKYILRQAMRGIVPQAILDNRVKWVSMHRFFLTWM
jgi:asparagine synthase (glutamine-hydrolysing)